MTMLIIIERTIATEYKLWLQESILLRPFIIQCGICVVGNRQAFHKHLKRACSKNRIKHIHKLDRISSNSNNRDSVQHDFQGLSKHIHMYSGFRVHLFSSIFRPLNHLQPV